MNELKLKRLAILITAILVILLLFTNCDKKEEVEYTQEEYEEKQDIPTDAPFDISSLDEDNPVKDYSNPTRDEELEAYRFYDNNCYFDKDGLHVLDELSGAEIKLIASKFVEDNEFSSKVKRPGEENLDYLEYEDNILRVHMKNMSLKETEKFLKDLKDEYYYEMKVFEINAIYKAANDDGDKLLVLYDSINSKALFEYKFYKPEVYE